MILQSLHSSSELVLIALMGALVISGIVKGIIGVGMPIVAMPLLSMLIEARAAVALLSVSLVLINIPQALEGGRTLECFRRLVPVLLGLAPGILVGVMVLVLGNPTTIKVMAGGVITIVAALTWLAPQFQLRRSLHTPVGIGAGFAGGMLGGIAALAGPLVFTYLIAKGLRGNNFTKEASLYLVTSSALLALALSASSAFDATDVGISTLALIPVVIGMSVGQKLRTLISAEVFKAAVLLAVFLSGLGIIIKSATF